MQNWVQKIVVLRYGDNGVRNVQYGWRIIFVQYVDAESRDYALTKTSSGLNTNSYKNCLKAFRLSPLK